MQSFLILKEVECSRRSLNKRWLSFSELTQSGHSLRAVIPMSIYLLQVLQLDAEVSWIQSISVSLAKHIPTFGLVAFRPREMAINAIFPSI